MFFFFDLSAAIRIDTRRPQTGEHHAGGSNAPAVSRESHRFRISLARVQSRLQHLPTIAILPRAGNHTRTSVLRSDRYVVARLCGRRTVSGMASVSGQLRIRSDSIYKSNAGPTDGAHAKQRQQNNQILLSGHGQYVNSMRHACI